MWLHLPQIPPLFVSQSLSSCLLRSPAFCSITRVSSYLLCGSASEIMCLLTSSQRSTAGASCLMVWERYCGFTETSHHSYGATSLFRSWCIEQIFSTIAILWQCVNIFRKPKMPCHWFLSHLFLFYKASIRK